jgi:hypothetical protein
MKKFRLLMQGQNFRFKLDDKIDHYGFYQNIYLEAENLQQAKLMATSKLWHDKQLQAMVLNKNNNPPKINLATYWELDSLDYVGKHLATDRTFYREKKWWQFWKSDEENG